MMEGGFTALPKSLGLAKMEGGMGIVAWKTSILHFSPYSAEDGP